jgi:hypothetical protein
MNARRFLVSFLPVLACLLWAGCDSKSPLSEPSQSKPDPRLAGVWRVKADDGSVTYDHVGQAGNKLPESVMLVVSVEHKKQGRLRNPALMLMFPTVLGNTAYLNVGLGLSPEQIEQLEQNGWKTGTVELYSILKYRVEGDTLLLWQMAEDAKKQAIISGKIKGQVPGKDEKGGMSCFTDTTENLARFVAAAGDSLFEKEPKRLERVK